MKVTNMISRNGNKVPNQFEITDNEGNRFFQSYQSIIAKRDKSGCLVLDSYYWDYSVTTSKYRNMFTGLSTEETKAGIKSGTIKLENLN